MTVTAVQIAQVRRMVAEPLMTTYTDVLLTSIISKYPITDELGTFPYYWTQVLGVPTKTTDPQWVETYDMNAAAAEIWFEKAAALAAQYDFAADGGNYHRSQGYTQAISQAQYYKSKATIRTIHLVKSPHEIGSSNINSGSYIGNLPEDRSFGGDDVMFIDF